MEKEMKIFVSEKIYNQLQQYKTKMNYSSNKQMMNEILTSFFLNEKNPPKPDDFEDIQELQEKLLNTQQMVSFLKEKLDQVRQEYEALKAQKKVPLPPEKKWTPLWK